MIYSGKVEDISWPSGAWLILDIGFSNSQKSCGILLGDEEVRCLTFNEAINEVIRIVNSLPLLNLVIEAPLSVAFDKYGNPKVRRIDKKGGQSRPWYVGAGCTVMVAAMYLVRTLYDLNPSAEVRLFEGFVSFKRKGNRSSHSEDVGCLRNAIKGKEERDYCFYKPEEFKEDESDKIMSAFKLMNIDLGIPPVIKVDG
ncbi:hypothetical protein ACFLUU_01855 [Chloroflexota bacterium]